MAGPWPDFLGARPDRDRSTPLRGFDRSRESGLAYRVEQIHAVVGIAHGDSHRPRPALASHVFGAYQRCNFFRFHILPNSLRDAIYGSEENILPPSLHATLPASHFLPKLGRPEILVRPFFLGCVANQSVRREASQIGRSRDHPLGGLARRKTVPQRRSLTVAITESIRWKCELPRVRCRGATGKGPTGARRSRVATGTRQKKRSAPR